MRISEMGSVCPKRLFAQQQTECVLSPMTTSLSQTRSWRQSGRSVSLSLSGERKIGQLFKVRSRIFVKPHQKGAAFLFANINSGWPDDALAYFISFLKNLNYSVFILRIFNNHFSDGLVISRIKFFPLSLNFSHAFFF